MKSGVFLKGVLGFYHYKKPKKMNLLQFTKNYVQLFLNILIQKVLGCVNNNKMN